ncbi:uncharacterized protein METZ01_LOCUS126534 [marine metagenome]|uniref:Uncharacterized protein n=1 Tax=marine metagenome TaxID=408172 RepID=A0A381Y9X1_9ZZZZ
MKYRENYEGTEQMSSERNYSRSVGESNSGLVKALKIL